MELWAEEEMFESFWCRRRPADSRSGDLLSRPEGLAESHGSGLLVMLPVYLPALEEKERKEKGFVCTLA